MEDNMDTQGPAECNAILDRLKEKLADSLTASPSPLTPRTVTGRTSLPGKVTAVVGMRRAGKTTFVHQLRGELLQGGVSAERLPYINFEDETLADIEAVHLGLLLDEYYRRYPAYRHHDTVTWCFDEIQLVPGWERFVRRILDAEQVDVIVTGSSASMLSREIATALRGRAWEVVIHPFSFEEALRHSGETIPDAVDFISAADRSGLEHRFLEYLDAGGFPEAQGLEAATRRQLLKDYVDVAILRDVVERHQVTNIAGLRWLARHLLGNAGGSFSIEKFYHALRSQGLSISKDTVHQLMAYLTDCFLVRVVWMESSSERQRMVNPRKAYPVDPGLIPIFDRTGRANRGHALETVVLIELERRRAEVTYIKSEGALEVDFLARYPDGSEELIQVCGDARGPDTAHRQTRALEAAGRVHRHATRRLLTLTKDSAPASAPEAIVVQPAYEWLLSRAL